MNCHILFFATMLLLKVSCVHTKRVVQADNQDGLSSSGLLQPTDFSKMVTPKVILDSLKEAGVNPEDIKRPAKKFLLNLYNRLQQGEEMSGTLPRGGNNRRQKSVREADTVRSLTAKVPKYEGSGTVKLTFNLTSLSNTEVAHHAELHIRPLQYHHEKHRHKFRFTILNESGRKGQKLSLRLSSKSKTYNGYLVFDITDIIQKLIERSLNDVEKLLEVGVNHKAMHRRRTRSKGGKSDTEDVHTSSRMRRSLNPLVKEDDGILMLYTKDTGFFEKFRTQVKYSSSDTTFTHDKKLIRRRRKRNINAQSEETEDEISDQQAARIKRSSSSKKDCGIKEFIVDFKKLGWNKWIVFPHTYNAFMCNGRCSSPVDWSLNPTNHVVLQSLMRLSDRTVPKPCCVPTKLDSLSMIYFEYEEVVVRHHEGMVVTKCGCR